MTEIADVEGRRVWDSRGRPTVEAEVRLADGTRGRAIAPAGASTGSGEALDRRDGGTAFGGRDVLGAVQAVKGEIAAALREPADVVFSALPHQASAEVVEPAIGRSCVIDLSADFRFRDEARQVQQPASVRNVGRGKIVVDDAGIWTGHDLRVNGEA